MDDPGSAAKAAAVRKVKPMAPPVSHVDVTPRVHFSGGIFTKVSLQPCGAAASSQIIHHGSTSFGVVQTFLITPKVVWFSVLYGSVLNMPDF